MKRLQRALKAFFNALKDPSIDKNSSQHSEDDGHLRFLFLLQRSSRLIDFLKEDLTSFSDAQIGMAVRKIQSESARCLEEFVQIRPILEESEGSSFIVPEGYDPAKIKVVGKVRGNPPYQAIVRHKGWKALKQSLPKRIDEGTASMICPAEVEIKG